MLTAPHKIYLLASDTQDGGTEVVAFATETERDTHLLDIIQKVSTQEYPALAPLLHAVAHATEADRPAAIWEAWDYYLENCTGGLDSYCSEDVTLHLPHHPVFTVWHRQTNNVGTTHVCAVAAPDAAAAVKQARAQCLADWGGLPRPLHTLGVAEGDVHLLSWEDLD
jgi:hypothetical protein